MIVQKRDGFFVFGNTDPALGGQLYAFAEPVARAYADTSGNSFLLRPNQPPLQFAEPLGALERLLNEYASSESARGQQQPRLAGFFSYELLHVLETIAKTTVTSYELPLYCVYAYAKVYQGAPGEKLTRTVNELDQPPFWRLSIEEESAIAELGELLECDSQTQSVKLVDSIEKYALVSRQQYVSDVATIRERIRDGLVYQVNLSQQFRMPFAASAWQMFLNTIRLHPSSFSAFMHCDGLPQSQQIDIVSQSPELFCKCADGRITIKPIKGTRRRGATLAEDLMLEHQLRTSPKDLAELAMIVDLERNDLGRVCVPGSIRVDEHARIERLSHVFHLVSEVSGTLLPDNGLLSALRAIFPCGSITGAPKIAAMQMIAELEQRSRGIYTGALGVITSPKEFLLSVAIRTGAVVGEEFVFNAGGGVVYDSDPELEHEETLIKAKSLFDGWLQTVS